MRPIKNAHRSILSINQNVCDRSFQFACGVSGAGISFIVNLIVTKFGINIDFPLQIHILHGFEKNFLYRCKELKNGHKMEIQCYFKDVLNTGISICHNVQGIDYGKRSYVSISFLGFSVYIANCYDISIPY